MKILVTAFDPFGGEPINPAEEAVKRVSSTINGAEIIKLIIPTVRMKSIQLIEEAINEHQPDLVLCIGQAGGRFAITPERVAINVDDFRIPDNEGNQPTDTVIQADGQNAYFSKLPIKAIAAHLQENKIPSAVSNTAGTFVCNHVFYGLMYLIDKKFPELRGGFMHIPFATEQVINKPNMPAMSLDEIVRGIELAIEACTIHTEDLNLVGGEIC